MTEDTDEVWVLWIGYTDGSGESVVRVYSDETRALQDTDLLALAGSSKSFVLKKVPVYSSRRTGRLTPLRLEHFTAV